jgi:hypothetical protein
MGKVDFFNKHYAFVFAFVFVITFSFVAAFYANDSLRPVMGILYGLIFVPMFFFFRYKKRELELKLFNLYILFGFFFGFLFLQNEVIDWGKFLIWSTSAIPFAVAFNLFCIKMMQVEDGKESIEKD